MKIKDILNSKKVTLSYEVFPPKAGASFEPVINAVDELCKDKPDFMSVTYGAGGGTSNNTVKIASHIQNDLGVTALAHLTCVSSTKEQVAKAIDEIKANGIENILALRGDIPKGGEYPVGEYYKYASELVKEIKSKGDFCVGAACYPEGHTECEHKADDIRNLKIKVDSGVDFLTTQMFFDNNVLYNFLYRIREQGITVPVIAGIMPVTNGKQISRICQLSGTYLPARFKAIVDKFGDNPEAMKQAGIAYATDQIIDLVANGVKGIHIYTMNKPDIAESIKKNLSYIIGDNQ
ncbi:methylenetetrahydrofolate reductase [NAD(P)H] [Tyzzerella sp. An114]|uniref:methylenetetrahydrofolate reductase [NAD(P)H] n=1 Tax=Tyzzerella sp. An114 TaxID=1965545 RepID=UPI000B436E40|nr:methylenetetrahydrofolate reductase [NAD(P)H] [Tyzzerella sp. An114]OUQ59111.1 methylenetetrahydrofolate reductase [NAD(P)H] [Tyzzerella sp. An114]HIT72533.1 methylenetetrahydrofolate reductase [NAD(P)H] [Candidatus Fimicola cottocaccae]